MNKMVALLIALFIAGCTTHEVAPVNIPDQGGRAVESAAVGTMGGGTGVLSVDGPVTAKEIQDSYNRADVYCNNKPSQPAFLCSGVLLRATENSTAFHAWNPNPNSLGVSFSYLRSDSNFSKLAYGYTNGFILYSIFGAPPDKIDLNVLCSYPIDADTVTRNYQRCGESSRWGAISRQCKDQGVTNAAQWLSHYNAGTGYVNSRQCSFNVRDEEDAAAGVAFDQSIKARTLLASQGFATQNEVVIAEWQQNIGNVLPIKAFFYTLEQGKAGAQYDQRDFLNVTGISRPIIQVSLPSTSTGKAVFRFIAADQVIPLGG